VILENYRRPHDLSQPVVEVGFTERQLQVVELVARGYTAMEIGAELGIATRTARAHIDALRSKLGVARQRLIPNAFAHATGIDPLRLSASSAERTQAESA
jgi:DNA-binding NarL/FixJ family response regulator